MSVPNPMENVVGIQYFNKIIEINYIHLENGVNREVLKDVIHLKLGFFILKALVV